MQNIAENRVETWRSRMTHTLNYKLCLVLKKYKDAAKMFEYTTIMDRLWTITCSNSGSFNRRGQPTNEGFDDQCDERYMTLNKIST